MRKVRNSYAAAMTARHKTSAPMKDRREKRNKNPKRSWRKDWA